jgi:phosphoserine phosphatase RsbU/P
VAQQWCGLAAQYLAREIIKHNLNNDNLNLESLLDLSSKLNESKDLNYILNALSLSMMGKFMFTKYVVYFCDDKDELIKINSNIEIKNNINKNKFNIKNNDIIYELNNEYLNNIGIKYCFPIFIANKLICLMLFSNKINNSEFTDLEIKYVGLVSKIASMAINNAIIHSELKAEKNKIDQKNHLLETVLGISKDFSGLISQQDIVRLLSLNLMGQIGVSKFSLHLMTDNKILTVLNRFDFNLNNNIISDLFNINQIIICDELNDNSYFTDNKIELISPLFTEGKIQGLLIFGRKINDQKYTADNINFIESLSYLTMKSFDNVRLLSEIISKKQYENELELAKNIQVNLLPKKSPEVKNYQINGFSYPSRSVGGDYYDFIKINDNKMLLIIADVSGKGMPAALIMASLQSALHIIARDDYSLILLLNKLNKLLFNNTSSDKFVSAFIAVLNTDKNSLKCINAGHNPPLFVSKNKIKLLEKGGLILGLTDDYIDYEIEEIYLNKDDLILAYTDGVTEAGIENNDDEYGINRLIKFIEKNDQLSANELLTKLYNEIKLYENNDNSYDDISAFALKHI